MVSDPERGKREICLVPRSRADFMAAVFGSLVMRYNRLGVMDEKWE
jgi:hypothetical protein